MHSPAPDLVLRGIADQLEAQVLPELGAGAPARQLRAALHALRRLERSWDRMVPYLAADAEDLLATLEALDVAEPPLRARIDAAGAALRTATQAGAQAPAGTWTAVHDELQTCAIEADRLVREHESAGGHDRELLAALYRRMLDREALAWGNQEADHGQ